MLYKLTCHIRGRCFKPVLQNVMLSLTPSNIVNAFLNATYTVYDVVR